ncbi:hypothetical protein BGZ76_005421, partial [Entomortierella beljakovae]
DHICGGALVGKQSFLTTADCIDGIDPEGLMVRYGGNDLTDEQITQFVDRIIPHGSYSRADHSNNIAILTLREPIVITHSVVSIPLSPVAPSPGTKAVFVGWKVLNRETTKLPEHLHYIDTQIYGKSQCADNPNSKSYFVAPGNICTLEKSVGACNSDSGGPLVSHGELVGLLSWGSCGRGFPDAYTDVSYYYEWINSQVV